MDDDITMQEVIEGLNITRVTGGQPAGNDGRGLIHASLSPQGGNGRVEYRLTLPGHGHVRQVRPSAWREP